MTSMRDVSISVSVMDLAGNSISNVTSADNTSVLIDRDIPEIISVSVISSNPNSGFAKAGDNLTLNFTTCPDVVAHGESLQSHVDESLNAIEAAMERLGTEATKEPIAASPTQTLADDAMTAMEGLLKKALKRFRA